MRRDCRRGSARISWVIPDFYDAGPLHEPWTGSPPGRGDFGPRCAHKRRINVDRPRWSDRKRPVTCVLARVQPAIAVIAGRCRGSRWRCRPRRCRRWVPSTTWRIARYDCLKLGPDEDVSCKYLQLTIRSACDTTGYGPRHASLRMSSRPVTVPPFSARWTATTLIVGARSSTCC
jgi:hypothetical protein